MVLVGQTGIGKSFMGNALLGKRTFKVSAGDGESVTSETAGGRARVKVDGDTMDLTVWDTPGLGDTKGRSLKFLDEIIERLQTVKPHALVLVVGGNQKNTLELHVALRSLGQCIGHALLPSRILLLVNKMVTPFQLENDDPPILGEPRQQEHIRNLTDEKRREVSRFMGLQEVDYLTNVVANSAESKDGVMNLLRIIRGLPSRPWAVSDMKTFTQVYTNAKDALTDADSLRRQADEETSAMDRRIQETKTDLDYFDRSGAGKIAAVAAVIGTAIAFTSTGPVGPAALMAFGVASTFSLEKGLNTVQQHNLQLALIRMQDLQRGGSEKGKQLQRIYDAAKDFLDEIQQLKDLLNAELIASKL